MAAFKQELDTCHRQVTALKEQVDNIFGGIPANRFRDVAEDIRKIVIKGIGEWIALFPAGFLQDNYLKYLAWALSDKVPISPFLLHAPVTWQQRTHCRTLG